VISAALTGCHRADGPSTAHEAPPVVKTTSGFEMVHVPAGTFEMGSDRGDTDEAPKHSVSVDSFLIDRYEVTQEQYEKLVIGNPSKFKNPKQPVERVRWVEAALYCNARSTLEGLEPCYNEDTYVCNFKATGYRLPTEAEWEYACRANSGGDYAFGTDGRRLSDYAWFRDNSGERTHPVGAKKPNAWGLFDMYGNVGEWCQDVYDGHYYQSSPGSNPCGPPAGAKRALRGGTWSSSLEKCRSSTRTGEEPGSFADACFARPDIGFRCVRRAPVVPPAGKVAEGNSQPGPEQREHVAETAKRSGF
jgi:formylglycine-generating enzyme required for sulfatase activity